MNALPEMLSGTDVSVLQRQRARMKWQQDQQQQHLQQNQQLFLSENDQLNMFSVTATQAQHLSHFNAGFGGILNQAAKPDPGMEKRWLDYGKFGGDEHFGYGVCGYENVNGIELNSEISRTVSCPPAVVEAIKEASGSHSKGMEQMSSAVGSESIKKRKADKTHSQKVTEVEGIKEKKAEGCAEDGDSKSTTDQNNNNNNNKNTANINNGNNRETSSDTSIDRSKITEVQKTDYIHVRARRGQATDSHSLAERVRREKISERMKYLQDLVPGCNKITGKAGMLDEIINYVQSLQRQVEFLSMKLAAVSPTPNINIDNFFTKEMFQASTSNFHANGLSTEAANPAYFQFNPLQQVDTSCGLDLDINHPDMADKRTISAPISITETFVDSFYNHIHTPVTWGAELQNLYNVEIQPGRSTSYPSQSFTGPNEGINLKMEM